MSALPLPLLPQMARAGAWRLATPLRVVIRRSWFYRQILRGPLTDHIAFQPQDALPRRLEEADQLLKGRFTFNGETLDVRENQSVFEQAPPSRNWQEALNAFVWLPPLAMAGGEPARRLATNLIAQWIRRNGRYSEPAWWPHVTARRLCHIFSHGRQFILNSDMLWRSRLFVSLREQARMLERTSREAPDGVPRLEAAAALALSGICMNDSPRRLAAGLARLEEEMERQILPDGGHASRSPEALLTAYRYLVMVLEGLSAMGEEPPHALRNAHDRMAPMLRFFRHGDGAMALFHGGRECDPRMIQGLLARDEIRGQPFNHARHSGYQRLAAGKSLLLLDCGRAPEGAFSLNAHAGICAIEFSSASHRIVVNCGAGGRNHPAWNAALRASAAHSTLVLADTSSAQLLPPGLARDLLGPRLVGGAAEPMTRRSETPQGWSVEAIHDAYAALGVSHERQVTLSPQGTTLTGRDRLVTSGRKADPVNFAVRFHLHPDIRTSRLEGGGVLLKLPGGEGWRFRAGGGEVSIEESVYLGGRQVRRAEQMMIAGQLRDAQAEIAWVFEQIGPA